MTSKRKEQQLKQIARLYLLSLSNQSQIKIHRITPNLISFQNAVEVAYASLSAPLKLIINNDFFFQDYPGWWKPSYKRIHYRRLKNHAINDFLEAYHEI